MTLRSCPAITTSLVAALALLAASASAQAPAAGALRVELGVEPEEVTVGEPFYAALRIVPPTGFQVEYADIAGGDSLQALGPVQLTRTPAGDTAAVYTLVAWVAGAPLRVTVPVQVIDPNGVARSHTVALQLPTVISVLPAGADTDAEAIAPQPPKGLIVPPLFASFPWWWWLALLLGALLAAWLAYRLLRRRAPEEVQLDIDPREWALRQLDDRGAGAHLRSGEFTILFKHVSWVARTYVFRVRGELSPDLTTTELIERFGASDVDAGLVRALAEILFSADRVKFARHRASAVEAENLLRGARAWVREYPPAEEAIPGGRRAA
jgi:hypothetical protein